MTNLRGRVVALERRRQRRGEGRQCSPEVEATLRRLQRCGRTRKQMDAAFARFIEATGRAATIRNWQGFFALPVAERIEVMKSAPAENAALAEAFDRWWTACEEERRHRQSRAETRASGGTVG